MFGSPQSLVQPDTQAKICRERNPDTYSPTVARKRASWRSEPMMARTRAPSRCCANHSRLPRHMANLLTPDVHHSTKVRDQIVARCARTMPRHGGAKHHGSHARKAREQQSQLHNQTGHANVSKEKTPGGLHNQTVHVHDRIVHSPNNGIAGRT